MASKKQKRELILDKAFEAFERYGLRKTTMDDIAEGCGLRKASLYYYFKSKEHILAEMIQHQGKLKIAHLKELMGKYESARAALLLLTQHVPDDKRGEVLFQLAGEDLLSVLPAARESHDQYLCNHQELVGEVLRRGVEAGEFVVEDPDRVTRSLVHVLTGSWLAIVVEGYDSMAGHLRSAEEVFEVILDGISA